MTVSGRLDDLADDVARFPAAAADAATQAIVGPVRLRLRADVGSDQRMSGVPNGRFTVRATTRSGAGLSTGLVSAGPKQMIGPWSWLQDGTNPRPQRGGRGLHPGTPPKRTWSEPVAKAMPDALRMIEGRFAAVVRGR